MIAVSVFSADLTGGRLPLETFAISANVPCFHVGGHKPSDRI